MMNYERLSVAHLIGVPFADGLKAQPILINFNKLFQTEDASAILPTIQNEDVLRVVVALLDTSLPYLGPKDIHSKVLEPAICTIILTQDREDALKEYSRRQFKQKRESPEPSKISNIDYPTRKLLFELYRDSGESSEDESLEMSAEGISPRWSWEQFQEGLPELVDGAGDRKQQRAMCGNDGKIPPSAVGVESLIIAAACYEFKTLLTGKKVILLSLLAVSKNYRHRGIGSHILEILKSQSIIGEYDTLVAFSETETTGFFKTNGFTDNLMLNDMFKELKDERTSSILMSYLPPFTADHAIKNPPFLLNLQDVEKELNIARSQALCAYQKQMVCVTRLLKDVQIIHQQYEKKHEEVECLKNELKQEKRKHDDTEAKFLIPKVKRPRTAYDLDDQRCLNPETQEQSEKPSIVTPEGFEGCSGSS